MSVYGRFPNDLRELCRWGTHRYWHGEEVQSHLGDRLADCPVVILANHGAAARICRPADRRPERVHNRGVRFPIASASLLSADFRIPLSSGIPAESGLDAANQALGRSVQRLRSSVHEYRPNLSSHTRSGGARSTWLGCLGTCIKRSHSRRLRNLQLSAPREPEYLLRLRGLDVSRRYRVWAFDVPDRLAGGWLLR